MPHPSNPVQLVRPALEHLESYQAALRAGWSADNVRGAVAAQEELARIEADPVAFIASLEDREARGGPVTLPDGSQVQRLPGYRRWIWDGAFCGSLNIRWVPGTGELPPHILGHIGYAVVPWKRNQGLASAGLAALLLEAWDLGLPWVDLTTDPDNIPSQRVIERCGGTLLERFTKPAAFGGHEALRFRILAPQA